MKVITVTLNPSLDHTLVVSFLALGYSNRALSGIKLTAAGRGMNVAEALHALHVPVEGVVVLGDDPASYAYERLLTQEGLSIHPVRCKARTRSNIYIKDDASQNETSIKEDGSSVDSAGLESAAQTILDLIEPGDFVVLAGSLPQGAPLDTYADYAKRVREAGARVALYSEGDIMRAALSANPELVVMTRLQAESFFNVPVRVPEDVIYCGDKLREMGAQRALIFTMDKLEAILISENERLHVEMVEEIEFGTRGGTIEALLAGYLAERLRQRPLSEALEMGAAAALYTAMQVGNTFGSPDNIRDNLDEVSVSTLDE